MDFGLCANRTGRLIKKALAIFLAWAFLCTSTISWAQEERIFSTGMENISFSSSPAKQKLAPPLRAARNDFKKSFELGRTILAHAAINEYIAEYILKKTGATGKINLEETTLKQRKDFIHIEVDGHMVNQEILIVSIPGLLEGRGQVGHYGLVRWNNKPVVYIDEKLYYDQGNIEALVDESMKDGLLHEIDEAAQFEKKRRQEGLTHEGLRNWGKANRKEVSLFHQTSQSLASLYKFIEEHSGEFHVDLDAIFEAYNRHGLDEDSDDFNIAAGGRQDRERNHVREEIDQKVDATLAAENEGQKYRDFISHLDKILDRRFGTSRSLRRLFEYYFKSLYFYSTLSQQKSLRGFMEAIRVVDPALIPIIKRIKYLNLRSKMFLISIAEELNLVKELQGSFRLTNISEINNMWFRTFRDLSETEKAGVFILRGSDSTDSALGVDYSLMEMLGESNEQKRERADRCPFGGDGLAYNLHSILFKNGALPREWVGANSLGEALSVIKKHIIKIESEMRDKEKRAVNKESIYFAAAQVYLLNRYKIKMHAEGTMSEKYWMGEDWEDVGVDDYPIAIRYLEYAEGTFKRISPPPGRNHISLRLVLSQVTRFTKYGTMTIAGEHDEVSIVMPVYSNAGIKSGINRDEWVEIFKHEFAHEWHDSSPILPFSKDKIFNMQYIDPRKIHLFLYEYPQFDTPELKKSKFGYITDEGMVTLYKKVVENVNNIKDARDPIHGFVSCIMELFNNPKMEQENPALYAFIRAIVGDSIRSDLKSGEAQKVDSVTSGSPAEFLTTLKDAKNEGLPKKAMGVEGITLKDVMNADSRGLDESTYRKERTHLRDLGILVPVSQEAGKAHYDRFSDMMTAPETPGLSEEERLNYTRSMINAVCDIRYQVSKFERGNERPLHRGDMPKDENYDKKDVVKELVKMTVLDELNKKIEPAIPTGKILWHILDRGLASPQYCSFAQQLNKAMKESNAPERIYILKDNETIEGAISAIEEDSNAIFDIALANIGAIETNPTLKDRKDIKMLVFNGEVGDFTQIEGIIAALRALHLKDKNEIIPILLRIYSILNGLAYPREIPPPSALDDPQKFVRAFTFDLPKITRISDKDIRELRKRMLAFLTAA